MPVARPSHPGAGLIYRGSSYQPTEEDEKFTAIYEEAFAEWLQHGFYVSIAGASHKNDNGTYRRHIIRECTVGEQLHLDHEPQNPYDANAVAVKRSNGDQLGYLPARTAGEVVRDAKKYGNCWLVVFRKQTYLPDTAKVAGAVVLLVCLHTKDAQKQSLQA